MQNAINTLRIQNFKSIKDVTITPRRVNIIIGEPNVGKSNILEAMSLLGGMAYSQKEHFMGSFIRYEEPPQLFYQNNIANTIKVETDKDIVLIGKNPFMQTIQCLALTKSGYSDLIDDDNFQRNQLSPFGDKEAFFLNSFYEEIIIKNNNQRFFLNFIYGELSNAKLLESRDSDFRFTFNNPSSSGAAIRLYSFAEQEYYRGSSVNFLEPPHGINLLDVIRQTSSLGQQIAKLFKQTKQKLLIRVAERKLEVAQELAGTIYSYPYSSTADTLQRLIFYLAAIESNDDAVLLFEEPEAHSYPVYVSQLARRIVESRNNQFFVVTHSPYLITEVLEEMLTNDELIPELAMFVAYYEDYQTKVRQLSDEEVLNIRRDGLDVFYNMARFVPER